MNPQVTSACMEAHLSNLSQLFSLFLRLDSVLLHLSFLYKLPKLRVIRRTFQEYLLFGHYKIQPNQYNNLFYLPFIQPHKKTARCQKNDSGKNGLFGARAGTSCEVLPKVYLILPFLPLSVSFLLTFRLQSSINLNLCQAFF